MVAEAIGEPQAQDFCVELDGAVHVADEICCVAAWNHSVSPSQEIIADSRQNGKSHFMEPLARRIRLPEVLLDRASREPLYEQIARQIAQAVRGGKLRHGARLPS